MKKNDLIVALVFATLFLAASVSSQNQSTAYIPFVVNVNAQITAEHDGGTLQKNALAGVACTLSASLGTTALAQSGARRHADVPSFAYDSRGNINLLLPARLYRNAEVSLYSVNGKRILRQRIDGAPGSVIGISRANVASGVYTLSVKGAPGNSFSARLAHRGGRMAINAAFGTALPAITKNTTATATVANDAWAIIVSAAGYKDSAYSLTPVSGMNPTQNITLRSTFATPRDSLLDYIDKNWQALGYSSKPTKYAALTFDDGPSPQTGSLLTALENKKVKATFFLIGQNIRGNRSQAQAIHNAGHELANHSDGYGGLGGSTAVNTINASLTAASEAIKSITGKDVTLFRAPNVDYGNNLTSVCTQLGLAIIGVSAWSNDYQSGISSSQITNNVLTNTTDGSIINCHEANTAPNTVAAIPAMIDGLRQRGFWISTVGDLAILKGRALAAGVRYDSIQ